MADLHVSPVDLALRFSYARFSSLGLQRIIISFRAAAAGSADVFPSGRRVEKFWIYLVLLEDRLVHSNT